MNLIEILRSWVPTGTEREVGAASGIVGTAMTYMMGWDKSVEALCMLMLLDYITGLLAAYISPRLKLAARASRHMQEKHDTAACRRRPRD